MKDTRLFRLLRNSPLRKMPIYHRVRFAMKEKKMRATLARMGEDYDKLRPMLLESMVKYHWDTDEFFMYHYADLTPEERRTFVPEYEKNIFCDRVNDYESSKVFESKWKSYETFKEYYGRECCLVTRALLESRDGSIVSFLTRHPDFIIKPDCSSTGRGIAIFHSDSVEDAIQKIEEKIKGKKGDFVLEELIRQSEEMSAFHPSSVNTIRLRVFRFDDRVEVLPSNLRLGRGDSVVDNTGRGGISASLNEDGVVVVACDESGGKYETHPDTGVKILGYQVPKWDEAVALVNNLCQIVPKVRYVGWDLALTDDGWVVIEGNDKGMFEGIQMPLQKGFRPRLEKILSEMDIKL